MKFLHIMIYFLQLILITNLTWSKCK